MDEKPNIYSVGRKILLKNYNIIKEKYDNKVRCQQVIKRITKLKEKAKKHFR